MVTISVTTLTNHVKNEPVLKVSNSYNDNEVVGLQVQYQLVLMVRVLWNEIKIYLIRVFCRRQFTQKGYILLSLVVYGLFFDELNLKILMCENEQSVSDGELKHSKLQISSS